MLTADEILAAVRPTPLLYFEKDLRSAKSVVIISAGELAAVRMEYADRWGVEVAIFAEPSMTLPCGHATPKDLEGITRLASPDEERAWTEVGHGDA